MELIFNYFRYCWYWWFLLRQCYWNYCYWKVKWSSF